jgi:hypothetical protein
MTRKIKCFGVIGKDCRWPGEDAGMEEFWTCAFVCDASGGFAVLRWLAAGFHRMR